MTASTQAAPAEALARPPLDLDAAALFLDLDGTLAPLAPRPEDVGPDPELTRLLRRFLERLDGRLAVVSGRTLADVDRILDGVVPAAAGVHGLERRDSRGRVHRTEPSPGTRSAQTALTRFAAERPGLLVEDKGAAVTLHYRLAPEHARDAQALATQLATEHGLKLQRGDMVIELKTPGADKGAAVRAFMAEPPFRDGVPVFVGDDLTDEDGFKAATALGGYGVLVASERSTTAAYDLPDVQAVRAWLTEALT